MAQSTGGVSESVNKEPHLRCLWAVTVSQGLHFGEGNTAKARTSGADTQPPINLYTLTPY